MRRIQFHRFVLVTAAMLIGGIPAAPAQQAQRFPTTIVIPGAAKTNAAATIPAGPHIQFASTTHDFGKVLSGDVIRHDYIFTNTGNAVLNITAVQAHCGCTTAGKWSNNVAPGQTGTIPIEFNTANFGGPVAKSVIVHCDDATQRIVPLQMTGTIWKAVEVTPLFSVLNIPPEPTTNTTALVRIVNNEQQPLTLSEPECRHSSFAAALRTVKPGKEFELTITATPPPGAGNQQGAITIKTSSTNMPVITVSAMTIVQPLVMVSPPQITLQSGALPVPLPITILLRNNSSIPLSLSEPAINTDGINLDLHEREPGRLFALTAAFPAGFELAPGRRLEITVKSSHPRAPIIRVPVAQLAQPAPVPPVPSPAASKPAPPSS